MITDKEIEDMAIEYADINWRHPCYSSSVINASENSFEAGAKWALKQQQADLQNALKGLGLDKHAIALNVLKIAGIELPKHKIE